MNRKVLLQIGGAGIAGLCLYFVFRNVDGETLLQAMRGTRKVWLLPAVCMTVLSMGFRVFRWQTILTGTKRLSFRSAWSPTAIGFMANSTMPARAGEVIRVAMLAQREKIPFSTVLASLVIDRLFDMLAVVLIGIAGFTILPIESDGLSIMPEDFPLTLDEIRRAIGVAMGGSLVAGVALMALLYYQRGLAERILRILLAPFPKAFAERLIGVLEAFTDGMHVFKSGKQIALCLLETLAVWTCVLATMPAVFLAFNIMDLLPAHAAVTFVACACVAVLVPTPGYLGSYQLAMLLALGLSSQEAAAIPGVGEAFGIVAWVVTFGPVILMGLITLLAEGVSLRGLQREAEAEAKAATAPQVGETP